jgi:hypothetical protein
LAQKTPDDRADFEDQHGRAVLLLPWARSREQIAEEEARFR